MSENSKSVLQGVLVGSIISLLCSFSVQIYIDSVQDRRSARADRAQHIERLSISSANILTSELAFVANWTNLIIHAQMRAVPDIKTLMPDLAPVAEMHAIATLYLPEVEPETRQVEQDYSDFCKYFANAVMTAARSYKPGDPFPQFTIDPEIGSRTQKHVDLLQKKLIELAKRNQAHAGG